MTTRTLRDDVKDLTTNSIRVINELNTNIDGIDGNNDRNFRRISNVKELLEGEWYEAEEVGGTAHSMVVPNGVMGTCVVEELGGNSVVWNQLVSMGTYISTNSGLTVTKSTNCIKITGTCSAVNEYRRINSFAVIAGHRYAFIQRYSDYTNVEVRGVEGTWESSSNSYAASGGYMVGMSLRTSSITNSVGGGVCFKALTSNQINSTVYWYAVDLTLMFGKGNEPTTTSDSRLSFIEQYAMAHPEYNAGGVLSSTCSSIVSTQAPSFSNTLNLPNGILSVSNYGAAIKNSRNTINLQSKIYSKVIDKVQLSSLTWSEYSIGEKVGFKASFTNAATPANDSTLPSIICNKYPTVTKSQLESPTVGISLSTNNEVIVYDLNYNTSGSLSNFTSGIQSATMYYEMINPTTIDVSSILSDDNTLQVKNGGTVAFMNSDSSNTLPVYYKIAFETTL